MVRWTPDLCIANLCLCLEQFVSLRSVIDKSKRVKEKPESLKTSSGPIIIIHTIFIFFLLDPAHKDISSLHITHNILLLQILRADTFPVFKNTPLVPKTPCKDKQ